MTVELAVAFPVLIIVAVVAVNALQFFSLCAAFDRAAHDSVRVHAASPAYGQDIAASCALVEADLRSAFHDEPNVEFSVSHAAVGLDHDDFKAQIRYFPTLFGMGLRSSVWGVPLPSLTHTVDCIVDVYKPGVIV